MKKAEGFPVINKKETGIRIGRFMDRCGISVQDVRRYLGLGSVQSIYHWLEGKSVPSIDNLYALSNMFGVGIDDIICGNGKPEKCVCDSLYRSRIKWYRDRLKICLVS